MPPRINIPPVTRILLVVLVLQSFLSAANRYRQWTSNSDSEIVIPYLTLIPQLSIIYPWTFLTTTLVENNIFTLAISGLTIYHGGRYLERAWSSAELAKFLAITAVIPNILCFGILVLFFVFTQNESWTYVSPGPALNVQADHLPWHRLTVINGTIPLQVAFLVAFSQLVPAHTVTLFRGIVSLRVPKIPLLYIALVLVLSLTPLLSSASFFLATFGLLTSWTYLRFYKKAFPDLDSSQPSTLRGDASETFAFAEFFPGPAKPVVAAFSTQVFDVLVAMRVCTPFSQADVSAARGDISLQRGVPGSTRAETERRRALALKALDQRLHAATRTPSQPPSQPSGPTVQTQPQASTQTAMTSQSTSMLGETNYVPDQDGEKNGS